MVCNYQYQPNYGGRATERIEATEVGVSSIGLQHVHPTENMV
jgi:hypothetical protein